MKLKLNKKSQFAIDIFMIVIGTMIMGFAFSVFLEPNNISTGGFSGLSMMINVLLQNIGIKFLSTSIIYLILNIGLFLYALKALGKSFALKALIGIVSYSLGMAIFEYIPINIVYETLISAIYGGALMGVGLGIVVRFGGSTGGSDMVASIVRAKTNKFSVGKVVIIVDFIVIFLSLFAFSNGFELLPYTIIALMISCYATDFINDGYKQVRAYYIITSKPNEIGTKVMENLSRGCTISTVKGMHSQTEKISLTCLVSRFQVNQLKSIVKEIDPGAFMFSTSVNEVLGEWTSDKKILEKNLVNNDTNNKRTNKTTKNNKSKHDDKENLDTSQNTLKEDK